jgi:hypothetical protein
MRLFWHLARITGFVLVVACVLLGAKAWVEQQLVITALSFLFAAACLVLVISAEKRLGDPRKAQKKKQMEIDADWKGNELVAGMRWRKWLFQVVLFASFSLAAALALNSAEFDVKVGSAFLLVSSLCLFGLLNYMLLALHVARAGYVLRMSTNHGFDCCLGPKIDWRDVCGVDVVTREFRNRQSHFLMLALNPASIESLRRPWLRRVWARSVFDLNASKARLAISCGLLATPPAALCAAARHFATQANPDFYPDWRHYLSIERLEEFRNMEKMMERDRKLLAEAEALLNRLDAKDDSPTDAELADLQTRLEQTITQAAPPKPR